MFGFRTRTERKGRDRVQLTMWRSRCQSFVILCPLMPSVGISGDSACPDAKVIQVSRMELYREKPTGYVTRDIKECELVLVDVVTRLEALSGRVFQSLHFSSSETPGFDGNEIAGVHQGPSERRAIQHGSFDNLQKVSRRSEIVVSQR